MEPYFCAICPLILNELAAPALVYKLRITAIVVGNPQAASRFIRDQKDV